MNTLLVIGFVLFLIIALGGLKHRFTFGIKRVLAIVIVFFLLLIFASSYLDFSKIFNADNILAKTGAAVVTDVKEVFSDEPLFSRQTVDMVQDDMSDKTKEITKGVVSLPKSGAISRIVN